MEWELLADQPLGQKLIKKWFWLYFFTYLTIPAGYLIKMIISNSLSVADVWILYSVIGFIGLLNIYNDLWLTESLQYFLPRYWIKKQYNYAKTAIYLSFFVQIFTAILITIFLWLGIPRLATHYFHSPSSIIILKYFCFYFLWINIFQTLQSIFIAFQDTFNYQLSDLIRNRAILWFTFLFFITGTWNLASYSINRILWLVVGIIVGWSIFLQKYRKKVLQWKVVIEKPMIKEYIKYALRCFLWLNIGSLFGSIIQQIIIIMIGPESAGYYTNFLSLFLIASVVIWPITGIIFPIVSELISKKDTEKLSTLFNFFYTNFSVLSFSLAIIFIFLWKELALIIFWNKFLFSGILLSMSAIFIIFNNLLTFNLSVLAGIGKVKERVKMLLISTILVIVISIWLISLIWIYGAIIGFCIGQLSLFILSYIVLNKHTKIIIDRLFIIKNIIFTSILWWVIWYFKSKIFVFDDLMRYNNLRKLLVLVLGFYIIFGMFNWKKLVILKDEIKKIRKQRII